MKKLKILYGICGIGNGHTYRQLPIVEHFSRLGQVMIFAHDNSYNVYSEHFKDNPQVTVVQVAIPFYVGSPQGLDFEATAKAPINQKNVFQTNATALDRAVKKLGRADLVITDYEPVSAQYAYAYKIPLITIDQQSKYLCGDFPKTLQGFTFQDEIVRLHMFFPTTTARIACSFFNVDFKDNQDQVKIFPSIIKDAVTGIKRKTPQKSLLVYISSAREFCQTPDQIISVLRQQPDYHFHVFVGRSEFASWPQKVPANISFYRQGDPRFLEVLSDCAGIVSTAGHSLLSEAMYLGIPVYAIPVSPYEQHMNARIIHQHGFGLSHLRLDAQKLAQFIKKIPQFTKNIKADRKILKRQKGQTEIIKFLMWIIKLS